MVPLHRLDCLESPRKDHFPVVNSARKMQKAVGLGGRLLAHTGVKGPAWLLYLGARIKTQGRLNIIFILNDLEVRHRMQLHKVMTTENVAKGHQTHSCP